MAAELATERRDCAIAGCFWRRALCAAESDLAGRRVPVRRAPLRRFDVFGTHRPRRHLLHGTACAGGLQHVRRCGGSWQTGNDEAGDLSGGRAQSVSDSGSGSGGAVSGRLSVSEQVPRLPAYDGAADLPYDDRRIPGTLAGARGRRQTFTEPLRSPRWWSGKRAGRRNVLWLLRCSTTGLRSG